MIRNIVFDIGNVLVTFYPKTYFMSHFKEERKTERLCNEVFQHDAWELYDKGVYMMGDLHSVYKKAFPNDYNDICYILDNWLKLMELKEETYLYLMQLKKRGFHIYLLSNISQDSAEYLKCNMPFFKEVDGAMYSYEVNINKPSAKIYEELLNAYQLIPKETIFMDDHLPNIEQAQRMGIHGVHFKDINQAKMQVEGLIESEMLC